MRLPGIVDDRRANAKRWALRAAVPGVSGRRENLSVEPHANLPGLLESEPLVVRTGRKETRNRMTPGTSNSIDYCSSPHSFGSLPCAFLQASRQRWISTTPIIGFGARSAFPASGGKCL